MRENALVKRPCSPISFFMPVNKNARWHLAVSYRLLKVKKAL